MYSAVILWSPCWFREVAVDPGQAPMCVRLYFMGWRSHKDGLVTWVPREEETGTASQELMLVPRLETQAASEEGTSKVVLGTHQCFCRC